MARLMVSPETYELCWILVDDPDSSFWAWITYSCDGGQDESTFDLNGRLYYIITLFIAHCSSIIYFISIIIRVQVQNFPVPLTESMLDRRTKRRRRAWQAGRPAVSSADRGKTAPTGPGTLSMLASGPTTVWSVQVTNTQIVMTILCLVPGIVGQSKKLLKYTKLRVDRANSVTQQRQSGDWHLNYSDSSTPRINTSSLPVL